MSDNNYSRTPLDPPADTSGQVFILGSIETRANQVQSISPKPPADGERKILLESSTGD